MKLSDWAKEQGGAYQTAWRWYTAGKMPVRCERMPTGTIIVYPDAPGERKKVTIYARVSSADRKKDMERQASRLQEFAAGNGWTVASIVTEVGSGIDE